MKVTTNPAKELVKAMRELIRLNDGYCICAAEHSPDTQCICKAFRDQMERKEAGPCKCGLYHIEL